MQTIETPHLTIRALVMDDLMGVHQILDLEFLALMVVKL